MISIIKTYYGTFDLLIQLRKKFGVFSVVKKSISYTKKPAKKKWRFFGVSINFEIKF